MTSRSISATIAFALQILLAEVGIAGSVHAHSSLAHTEKSIVDDVAVFDGFVERRDEHPHEFAHFHPYLTRLLNHADIADQWINQWLTDPGVYQTEHHFDWIVLERYFFMEEAMRRMTGDTGPSNDPSVITSSLALSVNTPLISDPPADPPGDPAAVPEPAGLTLAVTGLIALVGFAATRRNITRRA